MMTASKRCARKLFGAIWKGRSGRVPEILIILPGHHCDPLQVVARRALSTLRNVCLKYPQLLDVATNIWASRLQSPENNI